MPCDPLLNGSEKLFHEYNLVADMVDDIARLFDPTDRVNSTNCDSYSMVLWLKTQFATFDFRHVLHRAVIENEWHTVQWIRETYSATPISDSDGKLYWEFQHH